MAKQIVMDATGDTRHELIQQIPTPWQKHLRGSRH